MNEGYESEIIARLGSVNAELKHLSKAVDELKSEFRQVRETHVSRAEHAALEERVRELEVMDIQFIEFRAMTRAALSLGAIGSIVGAIATALHFFT